MPISKINSKALVDCSVAAVDIADNSITAAKLAGSIANAKLANSSVTINSTSVSLGASANINALDWQSVIVADGSTGTTGVAGRGYFINTTSAAHTFTLPVSATRGDTIAIKDYAGTFATFNLTIARNGHKIQGVENNSLISTNRASVVLVYADVTRGWEFVTESNVADLQEALFITATGGTITTSGDFKIHSFTGDGSFAVSQLGNPAGGGSNVDYLVVAGGGGGGSDNYPARRNGAGGGAGGFRVSNSTCMPAPTTSPLANPTGISVTTTTYPITVGAGGSGGTASPNCAITNHGAKGSNSIFSTITSTGGGAGNGAGTNPVGPAYNLTQSDQDGGSGAGNSNIPAPQQGQGNTPPVSPPQGNRAGTGSSGNGYNAGGGGGAGAVGGDSSPTPLGTGVGGGGNGGVGSYVSPTFAGCNGTPGPVPGVRYFAGGGGSKESGTGGSGGGGAGAPNPLPAMMGTANTGGGGGGIRASTAGSGGSGIVIIRYKFQ